MILHHCSNDLTQCHTHNVQTLNGTASGSFAAPDHDYPAYLEIQLTATDSGGVKTSQSVLLYPRTVDLTLTSNPTGLQLSLNGASAAAPFVRKVIINSSNSISASTPQDLNGTRYAFQAWSDSGAQTHTITAGTTNATYTATFVPASADISIVKTGALSTDKTKIAYTLAVTNKGPASASGVVVTDALPINQVQFVSASTTQGSCSGTSTVTCTLGAIANGQSAQVTILVNVPKNKGSSATNTAKVTTSSPDLNSANNSSTIQTRLR
jgi:uncharacterized repeat protein (TIGR01451 family)